jgi:HK97 family phage prohead protease
VTSRLTVMRCSMNEPLVHSNEIWVFQAGCFSDSLRASKEIHFQLDHDNSRRVASTKNALTFADDDVGLGFRLDLSEVSQGGALKREVDSGRRGAISVGIRNDENHIKMYGKHAVRIITKADLLEISLLSGDGACALAHAGVVDASLEALKPGTKGSLFTMNFAAHKLKRIERQAVERSHAIRSLMSRLDRIEGKRTATKTEPNLDTWYDRWCKS